MRAVLDTNVLVSGVLSPAGPPGMLLDAMDRGELIPVHGDAMVEEYTEVLFRPELDLDPDLVLTVLATVNDSGIPIDPITIDESAFKDADDVVFYAMALAARCPLVTGNTRDYPGSGPVEVLTPRAALERLLKNQE